MYEKVDINSLILDPSNARKHSKKNLEAIKGSLVRFGQQKPIVVSKDNIVIAGNGTLEAARSLGWDYIDVKRSELSGSDLTAYAIADNRAGELAEWDLDVLPGALKSLAAEDFDLGEIGFSDDDLAKLLPKEIAGNDGLTDPDVIPDQVETRCKPGDLWLLGNHRLLCGDSTDVLQVERLMGGEKADMVFTDPPYGISLDTSGSMSKTSKKYSPIIGDEDYFDISFILAQYSEIEIWIWGANYFADKIGVSGTWTVWDKKADDEINTNLDGRFGNDFEICWTNIKTKQSLIRKIVPLGYFARGDEKRIHPTQKPVRLIEHYFGKICKVKQGIVLDLFLGSGSTLIACEKTGRKCFGCEIDPKYCDVIISRWEKFSGKQATLVANA